MATAEGVREVRLAVVCYGGVSLAIYMHGITKEIHKLVLASSRLEEDPDHNPFPTGTTEHVYWNLLSKLSEQTDAEGRPPPRLRVVVDIISGTSAGGINGVYLAKALTGNRRQESLKSLWFEKGDIKMLLRGWRWVPAWARAMWILGRAARHPLKVKPPLRGDDMCRWLFGALETMDADKEHGPASLIPPDHQLDLFVPITDFQGYDREVALYDPRFIADRTHRHVMRFRYHDNRDQFGPDENDMLAFAARATSSFPGAFQPISFRSYESAFPRRVDLTARAAEFFPLYAASEVKPQDTWFIDGGVLDNFPFGASIEAIGIRPASTEVDRRLLYIEPDPGEGTEATIAEQPPGIYKTALGGYASIPRKEPILDDLLKLAKRNEAVLRTRDVIEAGFETISDVVTRILLTEAKGLPQHPSPEQLVAFRTKLEARALADADFSATTYLRLRIRTTIEAYAGVVADTLNYAPGTYEQATIVSVLRRWAAKRKLLAQASDEEVRTAQLEFLSAFDLGYIERRTRFLIAAANWWYRDAGKPGFPTRKELDRAKTVLYGQVAGLRLIANSLAADPALKAKLEAVFDAADLREAARGDETTLAAFVDKHMTELNEIRDLVRSTIEAQLPPLEAKTHKDVLGLIEPWSPEVIGAALTRYLGFPFWDILVYPLQAMSGVGERDHVEVYRMSPNDVELLKSPQPGSGADELKGMSLFHFGAFFSRRGRETDYLWGRLHGVERLVKLLLDVRREPSTLASGTPEAQSPEVERTRLAAECAPAFGAVLDEEEPALAHAGDLIAVLRQRVDGLRQSS